MPSFIATSQNGLKSWRLPTVRAVRVIGGIVCEANHATGMDHRANGLIGNDLVQTAPHLPRAGASAH